MPIGNANFTGLNDQEVITAREKFGLNALNFKKTNPFWEAIKSIAKEPMVLLLLVASCIYFISGQIGDGIFLASAIVLVATISLYQDSRSRNALEKLKSFSQPTSKVIRNGNIVEVGSEELVIGDFMVLEEGTFVSADGVIVQSNDFSVNESILTGESMPVFKDITQEEHFVFHGTTIGSGLAIATVSAIGNKTKLGQIGKSLESIEEEATPLEKQIGAFVKMMVLVGAIVFAIVWGINFYRSHLVLDSLLKALTLAMSILPEEIPVALSTFMALGAWRLMKMGIVVKQMKTVETLGSATVICTDKTGTITENKMSLARIFILSSNVVLNPEKDQLDADAIGLITTAMWASEPIPFDPMEKALHDTYTAKIDIDKRAEYTLVHEYPLGGRPPMMTHIFKNADGSKIIAAKGAPEALMAVSALSEEDKTNIESAILSLTNEGYRVLGVGETVYEGESYPETQQEFRFVFKGIVAFYDPPKQNIAKVLSDFYQAGIIVKIITGDNAATTTSIAKQIGFHGYENSISGDELMQLSETDLIKRVRDTNLFTRMYPEAKLRIINALKANHDIVAMTGDGVNDGPALKAAHIGVAMGKKGTEIAKQAASIILLEDDLSKMVDAIAMGRKIYTNLKKAIQYIISIHIPIILTVFIPLALGWVFPNIFSPLHVIFLELVMGPTCSIIYENEPIEKNTMLLKPRPFTTSFFNFRELMTSIIQGLAITVGTLLVYQYAVSENASETLTRTMVFTVLIVANIFLTLVNRSFYYSVFRTFTYKNNLVPLIIVITISIYSVIVYIPVVAMFFEFEKLNLFQLLFSISIGFVSVIWYEVVKLIARNKVKVLKPF